MTNTLVIEALGPDVHLLEEWSDAARAASAAARRARAKGGDWRAAGRKAFTRSEGGRKAAAQSTSKAFSNFDKARMVAQAYSSTSAAAPLRQRQLRRAAKRADAKGRRFIADSTAKGFNKVSKKLGKKLGATSGLTRHSLMSYTDNR